MHRFRYLGCTNLAFVVGFFSVSHEGTARAKEPAEVSPLHWVPCGESYPGSECAVVNVPLDYDEPQGERIGIQLARFPGESAKRTVFVNPGGPGGSGVDLVLQGFGQYLSELLGGGFDVVGFDPRGVASSAPLFCLETEEEFLDLIGETPWYPYEPEQERPYFDAWSELGERCDEDRMRQHMSSITDYTGAVEAAALLPNGRLLSFAGVGHTALGRNACITGHIVSYFQGGVLPPEGTVCAANPNPFVAGEGEVSVGDAMSAARTANLPWLAALRNRQSSRHLRR